MQNSLSASCSLPNPHLIHLALRARGSSFSDVARRASKPRKRIAHFQVRGVVYGYTIKHAEIIWPAIKAVLDRPPSVDIGAAIVLPAISVRGGTQANKDEASLGLEAA